MENEFHIIIPARFQSTRLPGKLLMAIGDKTMLERVYQQACLAKPKSIVIATDSDDIAIHAKSFGADVVMTDKRHVSGTDRIAEVVGTRNYDGNAIIVNVQADEPLIAPEIIQQVAQLLANSTAFVATLCWPIEKIEQLYSPHVVKVVRNRFNQALYFSRSAIPYHRDLPCNLTAVFRHIGLYAYRAHFLVDFVNWQPCELEQAEMLEQLRILWSGLNIEVAQACISPKQDVNTAEDLALIRTQIASLI